MSAAETRIETSDVERFLERFRAFGRAPDPVAYEALFDPTEGSVLHPGMAEPLPRERVRGYMETYLATVRGYGFEIESWAERNGTVFIEAPSHGVVGGHPIEWRTAYCITLRGDRVLRGRAYADRVPILARLAPDMTLGQAAGLGAPAPGLET